MTMSHAPRAAETDTAPPSYGHRSQAMLAGGFLMTGGQIGVPLSRPGPREEYLVAGTLDEQIELCLQHMEAITVAVGASRADVVEVAAFPVLPGERERIERALLRFLGRVPLVHYEEVSDVALHALIEMDWIAYVGGAMSADEAADVIKPLGSVATGADVLASGPFLITNAVMGHGVDMTAASEDVFAQASARLAPHGADLDDIIKMVVYVDDFDRYEAFNVVTQRLFTADPLPTRSVLVAPAITGSAAVRIDLVAQL